MRYGWGLAIAIAAACAVGATGAFAGVEGSDQAGAHRAPPCEKRVDGVLRDIYSRENISCRKAKRVMKRYILRKNLPDKWRCSDIVSIGKCSDESTKYHNGEFDPSRYVTFAFAPGKRA